MQQQRLLQPFAQGFSSITGGESVGYFVLKVRTTKLLFICSRNRWRSPTAEEVFRNLPGYAVRSAGTEPSSRIRITEGLIGWAEIIFVMERKHRAILVERFSEVIDRRPIHCLDIPDDYTFMDPDLVASLQSAVSQYIKF